MARRIGDLSALSSTREFGILVPRSLSTGRRFKLTAATVPVFGVVVRSRSVQSRLEENVFTRIALIVLIVIALGPAYFAFSAYTTVQAQVARIATVEQRLGTIDDRVKQIETDVARLRPATVPGR